MWRTYMLLETFDYVSLLTCFWLRELRLWAGAGDCKQLSVRVQARPKSNWRRYHCRATA